MTRHYAFVRDESFWAAEASECAAEQGRFWEYRELLYRNQNLLREDGARDRLKAWAAQLGLDRSRFSSCLDTGRYAERVKAEAQQAKQLGARGVPAIFVDDQVVAGTTSVPNPEELRAAVDEALARKGR